MDQYYDEIYKKIESNFNDRFKLIENVEKLLNEYSDFKELDPEKGLEILYHVNLKFEELEALDNVFKTLFQSISNETMLSKISILEKTYNEKLTLLYKRINELYKKAVIEKEKIKDDIDKINKTLKQMNKLKLDDQDHGSTFTKKI